MENGNGEAVVTNDTVLGVTRRVPGPTAHPHRLCRHVRARVSAQPARDSGATRGGGAGGGGARPGVRAAARQEPAAGERDRDAPEAGTGVLAAGAGGRVAAIALPGAGG